MGSNKPPSDADMLAVFNHYKIEGNSLRDTADHFDIGTATVGRYVREVRAKGLHLSAGAQSAMANAGVNAIEGKGGWIHTYDPETGNKTGTVRWSAPEIAPEDYAERFRDAWNDIPPIETIIPPNHTQADLCTLYPLMDVHLGMMAWGREAGGQDYDLEHATKDLDYAFTKVMHITPDAQNALLVIGGDMFHMDDSRNETPASKHKLDTDGRYYKVLDTGVRVIAHAIERLAEKHGRVKVRVLRGNHDEHAHMVLPFALEQRYRDNDRISVAKDPQDLFLHQWGRCLIAAHHGDKGKPNDLKDYIADVCPFWSETRHRFCFTGHVHHDQAKDFPGIRWESLRAFCPPDSYGARFSPRRQQQSITFHKQDGLVLRAFDPIERQAA